MNKLFRSLAICVLVCGTPVALSVGACAVITKPTDATTLANVLQTATLATKAVDVYVQTGNPNAATLAELKKLNDDVHTQVVALQQDQAAGRALSYTLFNAAMDAFVAYANQNGIQVPTS
jgi:FixJ family two-component response regulator